MDTVYIETSIVSHATAWPSSDVQIAALQHQARNWWSIERRNFELVTSQLVIDEASAGDAVAAAERLKLLDGLPLVPINDNVRNVARAIVSASIMPPNAAADALHVAAAAVAGVQYLLTLNCRHIANAHELPRIYRLLDEHGFGQLLICTPVEFLGGDDDDDQSKESNSG
jgi:predicted nucleic acid-binding protein